MSDQKTGPSAEELEISVFGPGFGECVLVHVGDDKWIVIDSCVDPNSGEPKALTYLREIGRNPSDCVVFVLASHWHDDHVKGIATLLKQCTSATFSCASALTRAEFLRLAQAYGDDKYASARSTREIMGCLELVRSRQDGKFPPIKLASIDRTLWSTTVVGDSYKVGLVSLSPSDEMCRRAIEVMIGLYSALERGVPPDRLSSHSPNDVSVVIQLKVGERSILLGSDLEDEKDNSFGWGAVLEAELVKGSRSSTYKAAHHGSYTGHRDEVWSDLLDSSPLTLLTPFRHGKHRIPNADDRARILALTDKAYISADPGLDGRIQGKRSKKIETLINATVKNRRPAIASVGHIRWRAPIGNAVDVGVVELFDGAMHLSSVPT